MRVYAKEVFRGCAPVHEVSTLLKGFAIGFSIAAPVGPIGVLCIRRSLAQGRIAGFVSGLGAATADAFYAAVAGFGLTVLSQFFAHYARPLHLAGGLLLVYLGVRTALAKRAPDRGAVVPVHRLAVYASTLLLTITNPMTIFMFAAIFTAIAPANGPDALYATLLVAGTFCGSAAWWLTLSTAVGLLHRRIGAPAMRWINGISGGVIGAFGLASLAVLERA
jgi:threonine/homoserine/homoserine lactone efflux protein